MNKLPSFKYKGMLFHNIKDNLFQTDRFGSKLIYEKIGDEYHLVKDERLSPVIGLDEINETPDYWWK